MRDSYAYQAEVEWSEGRSGWAVSEGLPPLALTAPKEFSGEGGAWTPEHALVAATAGCLMITFSALAEMSGLAVLSLRVKASGKLENVRGEGYRFTEIVLAPVIEVANTDLDKARRVLARAEKGCFLRNSLRAAVLIEPLFVDANMAA